MLNKYTTNDVISFLLFPAPMLTLGMSLFLSMIGVISEPVALSIFGVAAFFLAIVIIVCSGFIDEITSSLFCLFTVIMLFAVPGVFVAGQILIAIGYGNLLV